MGGTLLKSFSRCWVDVIADRTDRRLTRDLMFEAVPNSSASILAAREIWSLGGRISEIMLVPLLCTTRRRIRRRRRRQDAPAVAGCMHRCSWVAGCVAAAERHACARPRCDCARAAGLASSCRAEPPAAEPIPSSRLAVPTTPGGQPPSRRIGTCSGRGVAQAWPAHPRAAWSDLISFLIFQISMFCSFCLSFADFSSSSSFAMAGSVRNLRAEVASSKLVAASASLESGSEVGTGSATPGGDHTGSMLAQENDCRFVRASPATLAWISLAAQANGQQVLVWGSRAAG